MKLKHISFAFLLVCSFLTLSAFAQAAAPVPTQEPGQGLWLVIYNLFGGAVVSFLVALFKGSQWVKDHAKVVALALSVAATLIPTLAGLPFAADGIGMVLMSVASQFFAAIGTHEAVSKQVAKIGSPSA